MRVRNLLGGVVAIGVVSLVLGAASHFSLVRRYVGGEFRSNFIDIKKYAGIAFITKEEASDLLAQGQAVFIDSRTPSEYAAGHILGARSVPLESPDKGLAELAAPYPPDKRLVVYCQGGDCQTSQSLARLLHDRGFKDIRIYGGGWTEWSAAGLPAEASK